MKRLACLVIGDEILTGHVHESNSHWLANRLRPLGVRLARVEVCTDDLDDIDRSVRRFLWDLDVDYIVTSGGLGPTPDDRTMEGIALALGVPLESRPEWQDWMRDRVREGHRRGYFDTDRPNAGLMKMTRLPQGAEAMPNHVGTALGAVVTVPERPAVLFTLPGVPAEFIRMFQECVEPRLERGAPFHVEELRIYSEESRFHDTLLALEGEHPEVAIGSYPHQGYITIRATGPEAAAKAVIERMREVAGPYLRPA